MNYLIRAYLKTELEPYRYTGKYHGKYLIFSAAEIEKELSRREELNYLKYYRALSYPHLNHS